MRKADGDQCTHWGQTNSMTADVEQLPEELILRWKSQLAVNKDAADEFYFKILPPLLNSEGRPAHRLLRAEAVQVLVSLMGFSPETTVISTAILRPQSLVVVSSERAEHSMIARTSSSRDTRFCAPARSSGSSSRRPIHAPSTMRFGMLSRGRSTTRGRRVSESST